MRALSVCVAAVGLLALLARAEAPSVPGCRPCPLDPPPLPPPAPADAPDLPPLPALSPRNANYSIDARLDPEAHTVDGVLVLEWRNTTGAPQSALPLHLYWNAFRNTGSTSARGRGRRAARPRARESDRGFGYIHVSAVHLLGETGAEEADLTPSLRYLQPDDRNPDDRTLAQVSTPRPVAPAATARLRITWTARMPYGDVGRSGWVHDYHFVAQWFPKVAVFWRGAWNVHQFHPFTEFFSDFGVYDVRLTLPRGFVVGATGTLREERDNPDGTRTLRFHQDDVHDFAWVASRRLVERRGRFEEAGYPPVDIRLLVQPEHAHLARRYIEATRIALRSYGTWSAPYPYPQLTVVDPAWNSASGGMEYPTLFTGGAAIFAPPEMRSPESVTIHEAGHQFWYGLVATNEFEEAWLDEGLNSYHDEKAAQIALGPAGWGRRYFGPLAAGRGTRAPWPVAAPGVWLRRGAADLADLRRTGTSDVMARRGWEYRTAEAYTLNSYGKPALTLQTLEGLVGDAAMTRIMRTYGRRYRFAHPTTEDFIAVVDEVTGQDYRWFFEQTWFSADACDYSIAVRNSRLRAPAGFTEGPDGRPVLIPPAPEEDPEDGGRFDSEVTVQRLGGVRLPVEVRVEFADGRVVYERWDGQYRWTRFRYPGARVRAADVDPFGKIALDVDPANNSWADNDPAARRAASKWAMRWMFWLQNFLELHMLLV
ncbi:MAG TPA: M1 family metallopeptidase [Vicinamibacteria bacterium]|nr:M1 family metallopeptidase [Vicinamibacteria bacterium]